jgi:O-antigen ligase
MGLGEYVVGLINSVSGGDKTADFNVAYREELLRTSIALIKQSPWFGVPNYMQEMESLRQGEGIIDLVNTYLVVTLNVGLVGLAMFVLPFLVTLWKLATGVPGESAPLRRETLVWIALTLAIMVTVFTVSPVSIIRSILMWVIAFAVAMLRERAPARARMHPAVSLANVA